MRTWLLAMSVGVVGLMGGLSAWLSGAEPVAPDTPPQTGDRAIAIKQIEQGNFELALAQLRPLLQNPKAEAKDVGPDLERACLCLQQLGRVIELDALIEETVTIHAGNWRLLMTAANQYQQIPHEGHKSGLKFSRGGGQNEGEWVNSYARDRIRALQLLTQALPLALDDADRAAVAQFYMQFASTWMYDMGGSRAWKLQILTDLGELPDFEQGHWWWGRNGGGEQPGAPVDAEGNPVFYSLPATYEASRNDGERWRWLLSQAETAHPPRKAEVQLSWGSFLHSQFGVQTVRSYGFLGGDDEAGIAGSPYAVKTLTDQETLCRLATGIRRLTLPDEFNPLLVFRAASQLTKGDTYCGQAADAIGGIYEDRNQRARAVEAWQQAMALHGDPNQTRQNRIDQLLKKWGRFEQVGTQPARTGAILDYRFRNGKSVSFTAWPINVELLLKDLKGYLKSKPNQLDWEKLQLEDLGYRLVTKNQVRYVSKPAAKWTLDLDPAADHADRLITVSTPLQKAGAYLVTAEMEDGNVARVIAWVADTVLVKKPLTDGSLLYVADAVTGQPVAKANVELLGWKQEQVNPNENNYRVVTRNFAEFTSGEGLLTLKDEQFSTDYQWLIMARTDGGRLAYLGFTGAWHGNYYDQQYEATKVFVMTDRPVYRPEQKVQYKVWLRQAKYDAGDANPFAEQDVELVIHSPQGDELVKTTVKTDKYGGVAGELPLPENAQLGVYNISLTNYGGSSFRVEEYKKPEFEVSVEPPQVPVMLGEKLTAKVSAKYYFGAPVSQARVKYKVLRTPHDARWYPTGQWDWLYGRGYWWFGYDYDWYPGFAKWGCLRPMPGWWGHSAPSPEVVAEGETAIGEDGTLSIEIDTLPAKTLHGNQDHAYAITAEVTDESRRTIVGSGNVLVARTPYRVFAWVDRGYYRSGDTVEASFRAQTLDQSGVQGRGELKLLRVSYDAEGKPLEEVVETWALPTGDDGAAQQQFVAAQPGQYRLSYTVTDQQGRSIEGGYVFVVRGEGFDGKSYRFGDVELVTDKREYAPGENVQLMVNTERADATVLLFVRPSNGIYLPPQVVKMKGKSAVVELPVIGKDQPNFFIEAITVSQARVHNEIREVVVPPEKRVVNVVVEPNHKEYQPGAPAEVVLKLTDIAGKPFVGSTVVSVYDRSVDYIAGGSNVPDIREFFWKWRRTHSPSSEASINRASGNLLRPNETAMNNIGTFGDVLMEDLTDLRSDSLKSMRMSGARSLRRGRGEPMMEMSAADGAPMAMSAPAPMAAMALAEPMGAMGGAAESDALYAAEAGGAGGQPGSPAPADYAQATVRQNFADTAFWSTSVETDADGVARLTFNMPENLTGWKIRTWAMGTGTQVGEASTEVVTKKNLLVRLQAPRFFVERDEVVLSANVHNYLSTAKKVKVLLELDGGTLESITPIEFMADIAANSEQRVDWTVKVTAEGTAIVRMQALTDEESDAMQMTFPVYVHGMLKTDSFAGVVRPGTESGLVKLTVPEERKPEQSKLIARFSPTLAGSLIDALPYLAEYPHGCTEQTLNRFLPTVITQKILRELQVDLAAVKAHETNLNAQEIGDPAQRAARWKRFDRNPVFDEAEVNRMVSSGLERLTSMQLSDGGWGWFSGYGEYSSAHTTAVVVHGLQVARSNDVAIVPGVLEEGIEWLKRYQAEQVRLLQRAEAKVQPYKTQADALDAFVYMVLIDADFASAEMQDFLYRDRISLPVYAKALLGLALHKQQAQERLAMVMQNIEQFLVEDPENETAYLRLPEDQGWWWWYGSKIEANAYFLKLLVKQNPQDVRASRLVKYLLNNRKHATYWDSTRDTALCIEAMADYLRASGESDPNMTVQVVWDGQVQKEVTITAETLFTFDGTLEMSGDALASGEHTLEFRRQGGGPLYFNAYMSNFTLEDQIGRAGLELKVERHVFRLTPVEATEAVVGDRGQALSQKVEKYTKTPLENLAELTSGELIEVELILESKNDYEYLLLEDMKAAGFEPTDVRSGYTNNPMGAYVEFRDERVCFYARRIPQGRSSVTYRLRAEIPGRFSALPARASAMYAPELVGNSDEIKLRIVDRAKE